MIADSVISLGTEERRLASKIVNEKYEERSCLIVKIGVSEGEMRREIALKDGKEELLALIEEIESKKGEIIEVSTVLKE